MHIATNELVVFFPLADTYSSRLLPRFSRTPDHKIHTHIQHSLERFLLVGKLASRLIRFHAVEHPLRSRFTISYYRRQLLISTLSRRTSHGRNDSTYTESQACAFGDSSHKGDAFPLITTASLLKSEKLFQDKFLGRNRPWNDRIFAKLLVLQGKMVFCLWSTRIRSVSTKGDAFATFPLIITIKWSRTPYSSCPPAAADLLAPGLGIFFKTRILRPPLGR